ncbi:hypothetical protein [Bauldia litoralis]|uniref:Uncharacterized protein n=1 Tax=Bauldia litoralis TaxID=665467 RepID=A0A1G6ELS0_9HYPH|nr:hypothetical protein [Bauldia litoralis]SDB58443.1 hypothetical protein SAMN02982931_04680 [Bauldia litoralis]
MRVRGWPAILIGSSICGSWIEAGAAPLPSGDYFVVSVRRSTGVSGSKVDPALDAELGDHVSFGTSLVWWNGKRCATWTVDEDTEITSIVDDPILSDTQIAPIEGTSTTGDRVANEGLWVICDGGPISEIVAVDDRVIIAETPSSMSYVILEKALHANDILSFQKRLADMKFLDADPDVEWSEETLAAVSSYAQYRGAEYRFERAAITGNLIDGLSLPVDRDRPTPVKIVYGDAVSAYFYGTEPGLQIADFLAFRFPGEKREVRFHPTGSVQPWEWQLDLFSPDGSKVLLPQDHFGPYHVVRTENLKAYLRGGRTPDFIISQPRTGENAVAAVHHDARWVSNDSIRYETTCCGETVEHVWTMDH